MRILISTFVLSIILILASCSTNVPIPESNVSILRVELKKLQLSEPSTDHNIERIKYVEISRQANEIKAYNVAATANTMLAKYFENLSLTSKGETKTDLLNNALNYYQKALFYDKKEQNLTANVANPFPNADKIAISLNNISFVHEKLGNVDKAIMYAERAYKINLNIEYLSRLIKDCERLSKLYAKTGNKKMFDEYTQLQKDYEIKFEKQQNSLKPSE